MERAIIQRATAPLSCRRSGRRFFSIAAWHSRNHPLCWVRNLCAPALYVIARLRCHAPYPRLPSRQPIYTVHLLRHLHFPPFQPRPNVSNTPAGPSLCVGTVARHPLRPGSLIPSITPPLSRRAGIDVPVCQCSGERTEDGDGYLRGVPVGCTPSFLLVWWR